LAQPDPSYRDDCSVRRIDRYDNRAGRSAMRRYKELGRGWRRRTLGRWTVPLLWAVFVLAFLAVLQFRPAMWTLAVGVLLGMIGTSLVLLPDVLLPDYIARYERGAWGEQNTAKALRPLRKEGWLVRHDLATGYGKANRDHIAAGPAVYLLDSKLLRDEVWVDQAGLHVRRVDESGDEYVLAGLTERVRRSVGALKRDLERVVGFPVMVYGVVVVWGHFGAGSQWDGQDVAYVDGDRISTWLRARPADLHDDRKRRAVQEWLRALPRA
jgi:hypothetical protein